MPRLNYEPEFIERKRRLYEEASEEMFQCRVCQEYLPGKKYSFRPKAASGRRTTCNRCANTKYRNGRGKSRNPEAFVAMSREEIKEAILGGGCVICEEKEIACLDIHHVDPTTKGNVKMSKLLIQYSVQRIQKELDTGVCVVCANCHRKIHAALLPSPPAQKFNLLHPR